MAEITSSTFTGAKDVTDAETSHPEREKKDGFGAPAVLKVTAFTLAVKIG